MQAGDGITMANVEGQGFLAGVTAVPPAGQTLLDIYCVNVAMDNGLRPDASGGSGWVFDGSASGAALDGVFLANCWSGGNYAGDGWSFIATRALTLRDAEAFSNGRCGIAFNANCSDVMVQGCIVSGNARQGGAIPGIQFSSNMIMFSAIGNRCGATPRTPAVSQNYGIVVMAGASDHYVIANNIVQGNVTGGVADGGTGVFKTVTGNVS